MKRCLAVRRLRGWWVAAMACTSMGGTAAPTLPDEPHTRRSGAEFMSPTLQALQRDDTQNPAQLWVREGEALWSRVAGNGRSCAGCHTGSAWHDAAVRYPAFDGAARRPLTLTARIEQCRQQHLQLPLQGPDGVEVLALSAWLAQRARGLPIAPPDDHRLRPWQQRGEQLWKQRFGQLDLACSHCHDQRAGARLGGAPIPQAHVTGYPVYRLEWQTMGSLQRRLRGCLSGVRAEPFAADADEWLALESWLMRRSAGMPSEGVGLRP
jgi:sulfur-oxidizing protein SoxA